VLWLTIFLSVITQAEADMVRAIATIIALAGITTTGAATMEDAATEVPTGDIVGARIGATTTGRRIIIAQVAVAAIEAMPGLSSPL
jgi:hypothetical protein